MSTGRLSVIGSGILAVAHVTIQAQGILQGCDKAFYLVADPITKRWLLEQKPDAESLHDCYREGYARHQSYLAMAEKIVAPLEDGKWVCAIFYGHPGVFVFPSHLSVRLARERGHSSEMLPGLSAEDCLFADLGVDPASHGCQSFEATDFLLYDRMFDTCSSLIIWQIGVVGDVTFKKNGYLNNRVDVLAERLRNYYPRDHQVALYEAAQYVVGNPRIEWISLRSLTTAKLTAITTLYVPPIRKAALNVEMVRRLGLEKFFREADASSSAKCEGAEKSCSDPPNAVLLK